MKRVLNPTHNEWNVCFPPMAQEVENLNRHISIKDSESVIKYLPTKKTPGLDCYPGEFYQMFKEDIPILNKNFQKTGGEEHNSSLVV